MAYSGGNKNDAKYDKREAQVSSPAPSGSPSRSVPVRTVASTALSAPVRVVQSPQVSTAWAQAQAAARWEASRAQAGFERGGSPDPAGARDRLASSVDSEPVRVVRQSSLTISAPLSRSVSQTKLTSHTSPASSPTARAKSEVKKAEAATDKTDRAVCKARPDDNRPRGGGGGGKRRFIPWC